MRGATFVASYRAPTRSARLLSFSQTVQHNLPPHVQTPRAFLISADVGDSAPARLGDSPDTCTSTSYVDVGDSISGERTASTVARPGEVSPSTGRREERVVWSPGDESDRYISFGGERVGVPGGVRSAIFILLCLA